MNENGFSKSLYFLSPSHFSQILILRSTVMKTFFLLYLIIGVLFFLAPEFIQPQNDPFRVNETGPRTIQSNDIFINWIQDVGGGNYKSFQKVYRYKTEGILLPPDSIFVDTMYTETSIREDNRPAKNAYMDIASGKFNKSRFDNTVSIWRTAQTDQQIDTDGPGRQIQLDPENAPVHERPS